MSVGIALAISSLMPATAAEFHPVRTAKQAVAIAARNSQPKSLDANPKNWIASFDRKTNEWMACAGRAKSFPQSGFCVHINAKTGRIVHFEIIN